MEDVNHKIDYRKIANAIEYYEDYGFHYKEVPWAVNPKYNALTMPSDKSPFMLGDDALVGSGEQSFIEIKGTVGLAGKFCCATPCFRDENVDVLHNKYFMKVELIDTENPTAESLLNMIGMVKRFYSGYLDNISLIPTDPVKHKEINECSTYDLVFDGIELGSYGIREHKEIGKWIFGTGCAEPRLSTIIRLSNDRKRRR